MALNNVFIPYGGYFSSPFIKWQGAISHLHSGILAADTAKHWLAARQIAADNFDGIALGWTVPQKQIFYGAPWLAGHLGAPGITGPMYAQACATGARVLAGTAHEVETGFKECVLGLAFDRCSNGPHVVYPNPMGPGATVDAENWVWDNFGHDPWAHNAMVQTAENVAKENGITREEQDECTLIRHAQYQKALGDFQKRYIQPLEVMMGKKSASFANDEGVFATTKEGLAKLRPVQPDGTVTFGAQTYPADGNAGIIVTTLERAAELSRDKKITVQVLSFGQTRVKKGFMPTAPVPAAQAALKSAGLAMKDMKAIKTHNPFAVNDVYFARQNGLKLEQFNNYGSPLIYGHPQGPTGLRVIIELIEELAIQGGGHGLFTGCAAGDSAMACVVKVG